ncbi:unnamed protein product [marine sediment metagenome]|uniref:Uncharacterized protein n=1 Tax=marine sediment metagenome TaxID=412755 RepID=X1P6E9_9ZZZZ
MNRIDFMKKTFDYLDSIKKPFDKREEIETLRWVVEMIEDYLTWKDIKDHLENGCHCKELKGKEARQALKKGG